MEVPVYGDTKVGQAALPAGRISEAPVEAFGGGAPQAAITRAVQGLSSEVVDIASKARNRAIDTMTQDGFAKIVAKKNELLRGKDGALLKKGKDAMSTPEVYGKQFDDYAAEVEKAMPDAEARRMFAAMRKRERGELDNTLNAHIGVETDRFRKDTFQGLVSSLTDDAIANYTPHKVAGNLSLLKAAAEQYADDEGLKGDDPAVKATREALWKQITDKVHVGVINRLVAQESYDEARAYFKANEAGIAGLSKDSLEKQIKKTDVLAQKDQYLSAGKLLDKAGPDADPAKVIPGYDTLSSQQREALQRRYKYEQSPTAHHEFYSLSTAQVADLDRAEFETKYWSRFDRDHRRKAEAYWQAAVDANSGGKSEAFKSMRSDRDMVVAALRKAKVVAASGDLKDTDFEKAQRFEDYIDDQFKAFTHENGRNPKDEEKQKIINRAILDKVFVDEWGRDPEIPRGVLGEDDLKKAYVPITSIRRSDRLMLINLARAQGVIKGPELGGPSDDAAIAQLQARIERAYAAAASGLARRENLVAIMKGE